MTIHNQDQSNTARIQLIGRRAFIISAAAAVSGAAFWALRKTTLLQPQPVDASSTPANVTIVEFAPNGKKTGKITVPRIVKSDADWQHQLSPISYQVTRRAATERAYSGATWNLHDKGIYRCICCDTALFSSETKFESGTGWPSFWQPIAPRERGRNHRLKPGHGPHRRLLPPLRRAPGPRLQRRPTPHRPALLHELRRPAFCEAGLSGISYPNFTSE